jgi:outer membrane protein assembly factor BamE (lipoprotein component of BamABCDE complex)
LFLIKFNERRKKMKAVLSLGVVLIIAFTFSCAPTVIEGRKIDAEKVRQLKAGETKAEQLIELLGMPTKAETLPNKDRLYTYTYQAKAPIWFATDTTAAQVLEITLRQGVVKDYRFRQEGKEAVLKQ